MVCYDRYVDRGIERDEPSGADAHGDPRIGAVLQGRYRVVKLLGTGGMGQVYLGERVGLGRPVAIKFLHSMFAREPQAVMRFEREARAMSRLSHPNCISVIDVGVDGAPYIVMDHVNGRSLCDVLDDGPMRVRRLLEIARQILAGLAHAHSQGIVHRDIKPGNIMLSDVEGSSDHVSILDFGLAKFRDAVLTQDITASAMLVGTPGYMSPEQAQGEDASIASDLYAVGVMLFEMITDHKPYQADHPLEVLRMHREAPIPSLREHVASKRIPRSLALVVTKALAKDIEDRYQTAGEFARALEKVSRSLDDKRRQRRRVAKAGIAAGALGVLSIAVFAFATGNSRGEHATSAPGAAGADSAVRLPATETGARVDTPHPSAPTASRVQSSAALASPPKPPSEAAGARKLPDEGKTDNVAEAQTAASATDEPAEKSAAENTAADRGTNKPANEPAGDDKSAGKTESRPVAAKRRRVATKPATKRPLRLADVRRMIARRQNVPAIRALLALRRKQPKNAYLPYLIADLCIKQQMWNEAITHYRIAIAKNKAYRYNRGLIRNSIHVLSSLRARDRRNAHNLLVYAVGGPALTHLDRTARYSRSRTLRKRAAYAARNIRSKYRQRTSRRSYRRRR